MSKLYVADGAYVSKGQTIAVLSSDSLAEEMRMSEIEYNDAKLSLESQQEALDDYSITSPISGTVLTKNSKVGDTVDRTNSSVTMMVIGDVSKLKFNLSIDELDIDKVSAGQQVKITCDAVEGEEFLGEITEISMEGTATDGVTTYDATVTIYNPGNLKPSMNVDAVVVLQSVDNVLRIPAADVKTAMGKSYVFVKDDGKLDGVTLHIKPMEFVAIIGPSGSGKSTLMNVIGCLDVPTSGSVWIDGIEGSKMKDNELAELRSRKIGFIFQQYNLLSKLTAYENVELPLIYKQISSQKRNELVKNALKRVGLWEKANHKPSELSGGQQQRVSIARALAGKPALILADEPTGALDSKSGIEIMQMMHDLHAEGNTIVLITHDLSIAKQVQRIVTIKDGKIIGDEDNSESQMGAANIRASSLDDDENTKAATLD